MRCVVTGCAGFIGSHLAERLLRDGHEVVGIDAFTDYYSRDHKLSNIRRSLRYRRFKLIEADLLCLPLPSVLRDVEVVFHQAGQAGVRASWGAEFEIYTHHNVLATQALLEACRSCHQLRRFVYASSSSVYGNARAFPVAETTLTQPVSPYGVTKLAGEHLALLYHANFGVPAVALRYFTVYGARQRPDMAFHRFIHAAYRGESITVHEDGSQTRDFTHVSDVVQANILAADSPSAIGNVYNIAGGARVTLNHVLDLIREVTGRPLAVVHASKQAGDVRDTYADIARARADIGYEPATGLTSGLRDEADWLADRAMADRSEVRSNRWKEQRDVA